jgi:hypothetical protein
MVSKQDKGNNKTFGLLADITEELFKVYRLYYTFTSRNVHPPAAIRSPNFDTRLRKKNVGKPTFTKHPQEAAVSL